MVDVVVPRVLRAPPAFEGRGGCGVRRGKIVSSSLIPFRFCAAAQSSMSRATASDWVLSGPGSTCASVCPASSAVLFRTFSGETALDTALCSTTTASGVAVIGYEEGSGCTVNVNGTVATSETYQCRCTEPKQTQGLALPSAEGSCAAACDEVCAPTFDLM